MRTSRQGDEHDRSHRASHRQYAPVYPAGHSRRTLLPDLVLSMRPVILKLGLADERELSELDHQVREHFADPRILTMPHLLFVVRGRRPEQQQ